jgi:phenylacetate-coenzyme A ligase PaaK-like adenylate-forming protein
MLIEQHSYISTEEVPEQIILDKITNIIAEQSDVIVTRNKELYESSKRKVLMKIKDLKSRTEIIVSKKKEINRLDTIFRITSMVDTLTREGTLYGEKKNQISSIISDIINKTQSQLNTIEAKIKLSIDNSSVSKTIR